MNEINSTGIAVARAARTALGGRATADRYFDDDESHWVDIMRFEGSPAADLSTFSTVTLHLAPNLLEQTDLRVELLGVAAPAKDEFPNLLATAAFFVMKDGWLCAPGVVFPELLSTYFPRMSRRLQHVLFVEPFEWPTLSSVPIEERLVVHWLMAIPIAESERQFLNANGYDQLEALLAERNVAYFDLDRDTVI